MGMLEGKAIVITGSGQGIGEACIKAAARQGASVVVNDIDAGACERVAGEIRDAGGSAIACPADITDWAEAGRLIDACVTAFGRIDGLVNNAGLFRVGSFLDFDPSAARALVSVNVIGTMHCAARAAQVMAAQGSGSIVNVTSGAHMGIADMSIYAATKGAVASMTYSLALEFNGTGVRVNALSPFGATQMTRESGLYFGRTDDPHKGVQAPEANAPVVEFLLSDRAEGVTGQILRIDGGDFQLYTHPALLLPPVHRDGWTGEEIADAFDEHWRERMVPCGVWGMESGPVPSTSGYWSKKDKEKQA